jgi:hypothetical protein
MPGPEWPRQHSGRHPAPAPHSKCGYGAEAKAGGVEEAAFRRSDVGSAKHFDAAGTAHNKGVHRRRQSCQSEGAGKVAAACQGSMPTRASDGL